MLEFIVLGLVPGTNIQITILEASIAMIVFAIFVLFGAWVTSVKRRIAFYKQQISDIYAISL